MTFWEWLNTPAGVEFTHAVIGVLVAVSGFIAFKSHQAIAANSAKLDSHLAQHEAEFLDRGSTKSQP